VTSVRARLATALVLATVALPVVPGLARGHERAPAGPRIAYVVAPGDTLWAIARRVAPDSDPRAVVDALARENHVDGTIQVGQQLWIPVPRR
jgi:Tfp pilus assembly protein FimV